MQKASKLLLGAFIASALLAVFFGVWSQNMVSQEERKEEALPLEKVTLLPEAQALQSFELKSSQGQAFTNENLKGHFSLVFFGFTHCPGLCPTTLSILNQVHQKLGEDNHLVKPQVLFVSVDPERDSDAIIKQYLAKFNKEFIGLTGKAEAVSSLAKQLGVLYMKVIPEHPTSKKDYMVDHTGAVMLINPEGKFAGIFTTPHETNAIVKDMRVLINHHYHPKQP